MLSNIEPGIDVAEVCGGQGRVLKVSTRRQLRTGRHFDLTCNVDLHNSAEKHARWLYIMAGIWVIVMALPALRLVLGPITIGGEMQMPGAAATTIALQLLACAVTSHSIRSSIAEASSTSNQLDQSSMQSNHGP